MVGNIPPVSFTLHSWHSWVGRNAPSVFTPGHSELRVNISLVFQSSLVSTLNRGGYTPSISLFTLHSWALTPSVSLTVHSRALRTEGKHSLSFSHSSLLGTLNGEGNAPSLSLFTFGHLEWRGGGKHSLSIFHSLLLGTLNGGGNTPSVSLSLSRSSPWMDGGTSSVVLT